MNLLAVARLGRRTTFFFLRSVINYKLVHESILGGLSTLILNNSLFFFSRSVFSAALAQPILETLRVFVVEVVAHK